MKIGPLVFHPKANAPDKILNNKSSHNRVALKDLFLLWILVCCQSAEKSPISKPPRACEVKPGSWARNVTSFDKDSGDFSYRPVGRCLSQTDVMATPARSNWKKVLHEPCLEFFARSSKGK